MPLISNPLTHPSSSPDGSTFRIHPEPDHLPPSPRPPSQSVHRAFISTTSILVFCHHVIFTQWPEYSCYICLRSPGSSAQTPPKSPTSEGLRSLSLSTTLPQLSRTSPRTTIRNPICSSPYPSTPHIHHLTCRQMKPFKYLLIMSSIPTRPCNSCHAPHVSLKHNVINTSSALMDASHMNALMKCVIVFPHRTLTIYLTLGPGAPQSC